MHEVSWPRVKWPRPSWVRKDLLSVCGIVLGSIAVSRQYLLACCGGLLEASSAPLGGPLGASGRAPGADFGPLDGPWSPWAAPGPVPGSPGRGLGPPELPLGCSGLPLGCSGRSPQPPPSSRRPAQLSSVPARPGAPQRTAARPEWAGGSCLRITRTSRVQSTVQARYNPPYKQGTTARTTPPPTT